ncbi:hypothetical protein [uncultured Sunxiuqinia sp.]|uniref:hypothetical protein n=1 Tax=uncultured Sunxiuqinia sp. TaxID=1573825 RepID=UPI00262BDEF1|nr:hypothetical protein [uncultured Sunxiuqinia sp.]
MKTRNKQLIALMITLAAVMTGVNAEAQRRETGNEINHTRKEVRQLKKNKHFKDKRACSSYAKKSKLRHSKHAYKHPNWKASQKKAHHSKHWAKQNSYSKKYAYHHPSYGQVYRRFYADPVRIHHHQHGNYYFFGGHYYRHYRGVGYVRVEIPGQVVFAHLPVQCEQVRVGPSVYYRSGNLYFESYNHGYRLAPSINIQLSAHF